MSADLVKTMLESTNTIAAAGIRSGVEMGQRESAARIVELEAEVARLTAQIETMRNDMKGMEREARDDIRYAVAEARLDKDEEYAARHGY